MTRGKRRKLSPAERARVAVLAQEAAIERALRAIERQERERAELCELMGTVDHPPEQKQLGHELDRWELDALRSLNEGRPPSRIARRLPGRAYEAARLMKYVEE